MRSYWEILAEHVQTHPESLQRALTTIDSWLKQGQGAPERLLEWRRYLLKAQEGPQGLIALVRVLLSPHDKEARLRDFHPFAGILTREQRREALELCTYRH